LEAQPLGHKLSVAQVSGFTSPPLSGICGSRRSRLRTCSGSSSRLSPQTVVHIRAALRRALRDALRFGLVARNVATLVDPPGVERHELRALTPAEARAVLEAVKAGRLGALYALALATGLRQGEALGLRWKDVDLDTATLRVRQTVGRIDGKLQFSEPKTTLSRRTIGVPSLAIGFLREHRKRQVEDCLFAGISGRISGSSSRRQPGGRSTEARSRRGFRTF
jgi:integrase